MAVNSLKRRRELESKVSLDTQNKVNALTAKTSYEAPQVISYPLGGKKSFRPAYMGNQ